MKCRLCDGYKSELQHGTVETCNVKLKDWREENGFPGECGEPEQHHAFAVKAYRFRNARYDSTIHREYSYPRADIYLINATVKVPGWKEVTRGHCASCECNESVSLCVFATVDGLTGNALPYLSSDDIEWCEGERERIMQAVAGDPAMEVYLRGY